MLLKPIDIGWTARQLDTIGDIATAAGNGSSGFYGDGGPASSALLSSPDDISIDLSGNIYIAEYSNHVIRLVTKSTGIISTVAGTPQIGGYSGDGGLAMTAKLNSPTGVAVDVSGNIYIADTGNRIIRMVTKNTGIISTVAGTPNKYGSSGDGGPALSALLNNPCKVVATNGGTFYIADSDGNTIRTFTIKPSSATSSATPGGRHLAFYILYSSVWWTLVLVIFVIW